jgi:hypothetical protein
MRIAERSDRAADENALFGVMEVVGCGRVARMSGARGVMLFSKRQLLGNHSSSLGQKNSLGGGVIGARDQSGSCGAGASGGASSFFGFSAQEQEEPGRSFEHAIFAALSQAFMTTQQSLTALWN